MISFSNHHWEITPWFHTYLSHHSLGHWAVSWLYPQRAKAYLQNCKQVSKLAKNTYIFIDDSKQKGRKKCIYQNHKYPTDSGVELNKIWYKNIIWVPSEFSYKDFNKIVQTYLMQHLSSSLGYHTLYSIR